MKISDSYTISEIAGNTVAIPVGQNVVDMSSAIQLNASAAFICECLKKELSMDELKTALYIKYEAADNEKPIIDKDLKDFLALAVEKKLIDIN